MGDLNYNNSGIESAALGIPIRGQHEEAKDYHRLRATCLLGGLLCCGLQLGSALCAHLFLGPRDRKRELPEGRHILISGPWCFYL